MSKRKKNETNPCLKGRYIVWILEGKLTVVGRSRAAEAKTGSEQREGEKSSREASHGG